MFVDAPPVPALPNALVQRASWTGEDSCVPFFTFGIQQDTEMGTSGLILDAELIDEVSTAYFRKLLASAAKSVTTKRR